MTNFHVAGGNRSGRGECFLEAGEGLEGFLEEVEVEVATSDLYLEE